MCLPLKKPIRLEQIAYEEFVPIAERLNQLLLEYINNRQTLYNEKERLFITLHSIGDGVISTDNSGRVVLMNAVAETLTGWTAEAARGKFFKEIVTVFDKETREKHSDLVEEVLENRKNDLPDQP